MLAADTPDALSSAASPDSSNLILEHEPDDDDDWVVVKKQRITILVPPPSPVGPQTAGLKTGNRRTRSRIRTKRSSGPVKNRRPKLSRDEHKEPASNLTPAKNETEVGGIRGSSRNEEPDHNLIVMPDKLQRPLLVHAYGHERSIHGHSKTRTIKPPVGALSVVNQRLRALNLERKLEGLGGMRRWLVSRGLDQFVTIFEREKVGKYQLVNLTMNKLKDMGTDAVGPRRKLIHAIDCLCQPYYFKPFQ